MKMTKFKKTSGVLLSCLGFVAAAFFGLLFSISPVSVKTNADCVINVFHGALNGHFLVYLASNAARVP